MGHSYYGNQEKSQRRNRKLVLGVIDARKRVLKSSGTPDRQHCDPRTTGIEGPTLSR
jgi:hypothetical protein